MSKMDVVRQEMVKAMKNKDAQRKETLSLLLSALKAKYIDKRDELTEEEIKQTQETMEATPADRTEILEECRLRLEVLKEFAPKMMGEDEIRDAISKVLADLGIEAPTARDKGQIMKNLMPLVKGKADGSLVNQLVGEVLSQ